MSKKVICLLLSLVLLAAWMPMPASAGGDQMGMTPLDGAEYQTMTVSAEMLEMIKDFEGFRPEPYADHTQWSIGYGTYCGDINDPKPEITMTREEAEAKLIELLASPKYGGTVNDFCKSIGKQPSQQQFDALVDFTYNLGGGWTNGCRLTRWLENPSTEMEFVNALASWCRVDGNVSYPHVARRIREAIVFLWGEYSRPYGNEGGSLPVVPESELGRYKMVIFHTKGGTFEKYADYVEVYRAGEAYGTFPEPTWEGHKWLGYDVVKVNNKAIETPYSINTEATVTDHLHLEALWADETPPETKPTEPAPTEPKPTEPKPTEPKPTEPNPEPSELPFTDVHHGDWFYDPVKYVYDHGYMSGTTDTTFSPMQSMTRGMLVQVLYRIAGSPAVTEEQRAHFADSQNDYYTDAVGWAYAEGIVSGISDTEFGPNRNVIRQDAALIFYQFCVKHLGQDGSASADLSKFGDANQIEEYARKAVSWAVAKELLSGSSTDGGLMIYPRQNLIRAEGATILKALVTKVM